MGKRLVIIDGNFSGNSINPAVYTTIDFSDATVAPVVGMNISTNDNTNLVFLRSSNVQFYKITNQDYDALTVTANSDGQTRVVFTNAELPDVTSQTNGTSYLATGSLENSYINIATGTSATIVIPTNTAYIYIRKTSTSADTTPASAILIS